MRKTTKITSRGQVTIPRDIREQLDLLPHTEIEVTGQDGTVRIRKAPEAP